MSNTNAVAKSENFITYFSKVGKDNPELLQTIEEFIQAKTGMGMIAYQNNGASEEEKIELYSRIVTAVHDGDLSALDPSSEDAPPVVEEEEAEQEEAVAAEPEPKEETQPETETDDAAARLAAIIRSMIPQPKPAKAEPELSKDAITKLVQETVRFEMGVMFKSLIEAASRAINGENDDEQDAGQ